MSNDLLSDRTPPTTKPFDDPDLWRSAMTYGGHPSSQLHSSFQVWGHELESWCTRHSVSNLCLSWKTWRRWRNHGATQVGPDGTPVLNWKQRRHVSHAFFPYPTSRSDSSGLWNLSLHLLREAPRVPALVSLVMCCNQFSVAIRDLRTRTSRVHLTLRHDLWLHNHVEGKLFGISARHKHHMVPNSGENRSDESDH